MENVPDHKKCQKYLQEYPQIVECYVRLERRPSIEGMLPPKRKSLRLFMNSMNCETGPKGSRQIVKAAPTTPTIENSIFKSSRLRGRSKSVSNRKMVRTESCQLIQDASTTGSPIVNSVLKKGRLRGRSKSVSFDPNITVATFVSDSLGLRGLVDSSSSSTPAQKVAPVARIQSLFRVDGVDSRLRSRRMSLSSDLNDIAGHSGSTDPRPVYLQPIVPQTPQMLSSTPFNSVQPLDLTVSYAGSSSQQIASTETAASLANDENVAPGIIEVTASEFQIDELQDDNRTINLQNSNSCSSEILGYENRIASLVEFNHSKVNQIRELVAERDSLLTEIQTLHRLNYSLAQTVDMHQNDQSTRNDTEAQLQAQINQLQEENTVLRGRVDRLNLQQFDVQKENEKLKASASTYANEVLAEHNYV